MDILSPPPKVTLLRYFENPFDLGIAAARTCYSPRVITPSEIDEGHRERIGKGCFEGGHHTIFQHAHFVFGIENVSRHFVWAFLHSHPFYNSEQSSQRYVKLNEIKATRPQSGKNFDEGVVEAWRVYNELTRILLKELVESEPKTPDKKKEKALEKKAIEIARYVIPVAAHTSLVHTISGITLYRLARVVNTLPTSWENRLVIGAMVDEVKKVDPNFFRFAKDPVPLGETLEFKALAAAKPSPDFAKEFDAQLGGYLSKLVSYLPAGDKIMAGAVREVLGGAKLSDEEAIELVLNPAKNLYLKDTLNVATMSPLMRTMNHPYFVFKKRISHTADSQNQRHRMTFASRPAVLNSSEPDYITPAQIARNPEAKRIYDEYMRFIWKLKDSEYLLPNAVAVRFTESENFLNLWHKWRLRLCLTAQREIWEMCVEELEQIGKVFPLLTKHIGPDCIIRFKAAERPFCTQGGAWCGLPVWVWKEMEKEKRPY